MANRLLTRFRNWRKLRRWHREGCPVPPPHAHKILTLRGLAAKHGVRVLVETGTYLGDMMAAQKGSFDRLISIELSEELHRRACERFRKDPQVQILQGDSGTVIAQVVAGLKQPALFWLDGHYSGGETARGMLDSPIVQELEAVYASALPHLVVVDDMHCFNGSGGYPTVEALEQLVLRLRPGAKVRVEHNLLIVE